VVDDVQLAESVEPAVVRERRELGRMLFRNVHHVAQPVVDEPMPGAVKCRAHAAAAVVTTDDHVPHAEDVDGVLQHGEAVEVRVHDDVRDVAMDEHLARCEPDDLIRRDAAVGAADPEVLRRLPIGEPREELGIVSDHVCRPRPVVLEELREIDHSGTLSRRRGSTTTIVPWRICLSERSRSRSPTSRTRPSSSSVWATTTARC
jgi:hypothetical protein